LSFSNGVHVTLCMRAQCAPWTNPIPTGVPCRVGRPTGLLA